MKRIFATLFIGVLLMIPAIGQENQDKLKELEQLEEQASKAALPDTIILDEEYNTQRETTTVVTAERREQVAETEDYIDNTSSIRIGKNINIEEKEDSVIVKVGSKVIVINEDGNDTSIDFYDKDKELRKERRSRQFRGHLEGFEWGFNTYLNEDYTSELDPAYSFLNLNTSKSQCFNMFFPNVSLGITKRFGIVSAVGLNFNEYRFDGNNTIGTDANGNIINPDPAQTLNYEKSKLATLYAVLPVMLEVQIPVSRGDAINIGAGVIGAVKLDSHTKVVYYEDGRQKERNNDDFSLNLLRYGVTARLGYGMFQVYGTCYLSEMFEKGKAPALHPLEIGIALTIND